MGAGKRTITSMALTVLLAFLALAGATSVGASSEIHLRLHYQGVILQAMTPLPSKSFDTSVLGAEAGLARIRSALDRLISGSPHSARRLRRLLDNGRVFLIYSPSDLKNDHGGENVATFLPDYRLKSTTHDARKDFRVVIGRHGVKWPIDELAAILAHELSGHAVQQQRGWLTSIRYLDAECEANLHEEIANQELGLDKSSRRMMAFRDALENRWCADFKAYMRAHRPGALTLWDRKHPEVPGLLDVFEQYRQHSIQTGATARAMDALKDQTRESRWRAYHRASPEMLLQIAHKLRAGGIGIRPDPEEAFRYFRRATELRTTTSRMKGVSPALSSIGTGFGKMAISPRP